MRIFRLIISADLIITLILLLMLFILRLSTQKDLPALLIVVISFLLILNILFCIYSLREIRKGKGKLIQKLWISYFVLIFGFIITDIIAGQVLLQKSSPETIEDRTLHHVMVPNTTAVIRNPLDYYTEVKINNIGCRGKDISEIKGDNTLRVLMLGDSFTMGIGVNDNETFSVLLEEMLNKDEDKNYEVINCGVNSYSPIIEYLQLKQNIDFIKPDIVILNFDMSDLIQDYTYYFDAITNEKGDIKAIYGLSIKGEKRYKELHKKLQSWIRKNMLIGANMLEYIYKHSVRYEMISFENVVLRASAKAMLHTLEGYDEEEFKKYFSLVKQNLTSIKELCIAKGCKLIVTTYPWGHQVNGREWIPGRYLFVTKNTKISDRTVLELEKFSEQINVKFINTFPDFRNYEGDKPLYFKHDPHWTKEGHQIMAESLYNSLDTSAITN